MRLRLSKLWDEFLPEKWAQNALNAFVGDGVTRIKDFVCPPKIRGPGAALRGLLSNITGVTKS